MKELISNTVVAIMGMFKHPLAKVSALAIICITVVMLSGCQMTASDVSGNIGDNEVSLGDINAVWSVIDENSDTMLKLVDEIY